MDGKEISEHRSAVLIKEKRRYKDNLQKNSSFSGELKIVEEEFDARCKNRQTSKKLVVHQKLP